MSSLAAVASPSPGGQSYEGDYQEEGEYEGEESGGEYDEEEVTESAAFYAGARRSTQDSDSPRRKLVTDGQDGEDHAEPEERSWTGTSKYLRESVHASRMMAMLDTTHLMMETTEQLGRLSFLQERTHEEHRAFVRAVYQDVLKRLRDEGHAPEAMGLFSGKSSDTPKKKKAKGEPVKRLRDIALVVQSGVHRVQTQARVAESFNKLQRPKKVRRILVEGLESWMSRAFNNPENARIRNLLELAAQMRAEVERIVLDTEANGDGGGEFGNLAQELKGLLFSIRRGDELTNEIDEFLLGDFNESQDLTAVVERWAITMSDIKAKFRKFGVSEKHLTMWDPFETLIVRCAAAGEPGDVVLDLLGEFDPDGWMNPASGDPRRSMAAPRQSTGFQIQNEIRRSTVKRMSAVGLPVEVAQRYSVRNSLVPNARASIPSHRMSMSQPQRLSVMPVLDEDNKASTLPVDLQDIENKPRFFTPSALRFEKFKKRMNKQTGSTQTKGAFRGFGESTGNKDEDDFHGEKPPVTCTHLEGLHGFANGHGDQSVTRLILPEDVRSQFVEAWTEVIDSRLALENLKQMDRGRLMSAQRFAEQLAFKPIDLGPRRKRYNGPRPPSEEFAPPGAREFGESPFSGGGGSRGSSRGDPGDPPALPRMF